MDEHLYTDKNVKTTE